MYAYVTRGPFAPRSLAARETADGAEAAEREDEIDAATRSAECDPLEEEEEEDR